MCEQPSRPPSHARRTTQNWPHPPTVTVLSFTLEPPAGLHARKRNSTPSGVGCQPSDAAPERQDTRTDPKINPGVVGSGVGLAYPNDACPWCQALVRRPVVAGEASRHPLPWDRSPEPRSSRRVYRDWVWGPAVRSALRAEGTSSVISLRQTVAQRIAGDSTAAPGWLSREATEDFLVPDGIERVEFGGRDT